jgi:hypothetical protein
MTELLFDTPWWLPTLVAVVGVVLFVSGNKRVDLTLRNVGIGIFGLAILLVLLSWIVDTPKERAVKGTRQLVDSVEKKDWQKMRSLLDPKVSFFTYGNRDVLVDAVKRASEEQGVRSIVITSLEAKQADTLITVTLTAYATLDATQGRPFRSDWSLDWIETADGWVLRTIKLLPTPAGRTRRSRSTCRDRDFCPSPLYSRGEDG